MAADAPVLIVQVQGYVMKPFSGAEIVKAISDLTGLGDGEVTS